jgi:Tripartite tricarboxylate transporter family receptor
LILRERAGPSTSRNVESPSPRLAPPGVRATRLQALLKKIEGGKKAWKQLNYIEEHNASAILASIRSERLASPLTRRGGSRARTGWWKLHVGENADFAGGENGSCIPLPIADKLSAEVGVVLNPPDVKERLAASGLEVNPTTPEEFAAVVKDESEKWGKVIRTAGIHLD